MYKNFVRWATGQGCTVGPLTQYANNEIYKELIKMKTITQKLKVMKNCMLTSEEEEVFQTNYKE